MMKYYKKNNTIKSANNIVVVKDGFQIINPSHEEILADGWIEYTEKQPTEEELLEQARQSKLYEIDEYDTSDAVNSFSYKGVQMWFSKADRVGLMNSLNIEKNAGRTESTMWFGGNALVVNIDEGIALLNAIELYALDCYNVTARHKADVSALQTIEEIDAYDIKKGYPKKLKF